MVHRKNVAQTVRSKKKYKTVLLAVSSTSSSAFSQLIAEELVLLIANSL